MKRRRFESHIDKRLAQVLAEFHWSAMKSNRATDIAPMAMMPVTFTHAFCVCANGCDGVTRVLLD